MYTYIYIHVSNLGARRCLLTETGTGMRVLGKGLLLVDEASQLQPFFSCMASYLACVTTCTTTVLCSVCGQPMAAAPPKVHCETPVCCRGRRCGGAPWARRRPGLRLFLFPKQTKSHNIYYALRASNHSRFFFLILHLLDKKSIGPRPTSATFSPMVSPGRKQATLILFPEVFHIRGRDENDL